ncbi:MAG: aldehyde dehydrogenase family protein, partial [Rhodospirillaceae bacterium]|nr:aldehyde dehydrogenase family protein [Rhodospirillaceae bacterium]
MTIALPSAGVCDDIDNQLLCRSMAPECAMGARGRTELKDAKMPELHKNLIAGEWVDGEAAANINPSNPNDIVGHYARASAADTHRAIAAARAAFPAWSRSGPLERHAILRKAADEILARKDELGRLLSQEEGKVLAEGI